MRFLLSLLGGLLITAAVFLFMQSLIKSRQQQDGKPKKVYPTYQRPQPSF